jgi:hypothetical protein
MKIVLDTSLYIDSLSSRDKRLNVQINVQVNDPERTQNLRSELLNTFSSIEMYTGSNTHI